MAYTTSNFKTKKALKEAVAFWKQHKDVCPCKDKNRYAVCAFQPGLGPDLSQFTGRAAVEGPHYPAPHTWYADCDFEDGIITRVR